MTSSIKIFSRTPKSTADIGRRLAGRLRPGAVIALFGDLGAGKTVIAQAIGRGLSIRRPLRSPTFVIESRYPVPSKTIRTLYHLDLYRMKRVSALDLQNITEALTDKRGIVVIEWADRLGRHLPKKSIRIKLNITADGRSVTISGLSSRELKSLASLSSAVGDATRS